MRWLAVERHEEEVTTSTLLVSRRKPVDDWLKLSASAFEAFNLPTLPTALSLPSIMVIVSFPAKSISTLRNGGKYR
jgi:hypothetical protein